MRTYLDHIDDIFYFGKFQGCTLAEVLIYNPSYIQWVAENVSVQICEITENALNEIRLMFPSFPITRAIEMQNEQYCPLDEDDEDWYSEDPDDSYQMYDDEPTYDRYNGSYAQDVMGYSDDDIDTIFDGEPDAYWNID